MPNFSGDTVTFNKAHVESIADRLASEAKSLGGENDTLQGNIKHLLEVGFQGEPANAFNMANKDLNTSIEGILGTMDALAKAVHEVCENMVKVNQQNANLFTQA